MLDLTRKEVRDCIYEQISAVLRSRVTPFEIRGRVSLPGCFGYELDLDKLSPEEQVKSPSKFS